MAIKTLIRKKTTKAHKDRQRLSLMIHLRTQTLAQPGLISGETFLRIDKMNNP